MKILKAPPDIKAWKRSCSCKKCTAILEIEASDIYAEYHSSCDPREPGAWWTYSVSCPCCKNAIFLASEFFDDSSFVRLSIEAAHRSR